jgi:hypothetical protein
MTLDHFIDEYRNLIDKVRMSETVPLPELLDFLAVEIETLESQAYEGEPY